METLWIAFIFQYLWDTKQHSIDKLPLVFSCELLSFFSIFGIQNNNILKTRVRFSLWIAFIFQYLWDTKQLYWLRPHGGGSCELLSFFSIFGIQNNLFLRMVGRNKVVNCFHFSVSLGYKTTFQTNLFLLILLFLLHVFSQLQQNQQIQQILRY